MVALRDLFKNPNAAELELAQEFSRLPHNGQRHRNFEAFAATGLPHRRVEAWKYTDLKSVLQQVPEVTGAALPADPFEAVENALVLRFTSKGVTVPETLPDGLRIITQTDPQALAGAEETPVAALGAALSRNPGSLIVEVTKPVTMPVRLVFETTSSLAFSRVAFVLRENAELDVFESHLASGGFSSRVIEYTLKDGARLGRTVFQDADPSAIQVFTCIAHLENSARLQQSGLGCGARLCRNETRVFHHGKGASAELNGAYLIGAGRHYDQTSLVRHSRPECTTRQLVKGAVLDEGHAVFQGKFYVARKAQQTDATMGHHALILENGGEISAKPELEIYADDVQCAHGNTVGALDGDALFYLRQRGIPERSARALLTEAFILETFGAITETAGELLTAEARRWLEASV